MRARDGRVADLEHKVSDYERRLARADVTAGQWKQHYEMLRGPARGLGVVQSTTKTSRQVADLLNQISLLEDRLTVARGNLNDERHQAQHVIGGLHQKIKEVEQERDQAKVELGRAQLLYKAALTKRYQDSLKDPADNGWWWLVLKPDQMQEAAQALIVSQNLQKRANDRANELRDDLEASKRVVAKQGEIMNKQDAIIKGQQKNLEMRGNLQGSYDLSFAALALRTPAEKLGELKGDWMKAMANEKVLSEAHLNAAIDAACSKQQLEQEKREWVEEVQDLKEKIHEVRSELVESQVKFQETNGEKHELETSLQQMTTDRDQCRSDARDLRRQLEERAFGGDTEILWQEHCETLQKAQQIVQNQQQLISDREQDYALQDQSVQYMHGQLERLHPVAMHIIDKDRYHAIVCAMLHRFEGQLREKKLIVDVTDFVAVYDEDEGARFLDFGDMARLMDAYCDEKIILEGRQASKFSEEEIEAARLAIEAVAQQDRERWMQQARVEDAAWEERQKNGSRQHKASEAEVERRWREEHGLPPIEQMYRYEGSRSSTQNEH